MKIIICFRRMQNCPKPHPDLFSDNSRWMEAGASADYKAADEPRPDPPWPAQGAVPHVLGSLHTGLSGSTVLTGGQAQDDPGGFSPRCGYSGSAESCLSSRHSDNSIDSV